MSTQINKDDVQTGTLQTDQLDLTDASKGVSGDHLRMEAAVPGTTIKAYTDTAATGAIAAHAALTATHGALDIADVSDIAVDVNLSVAANDAITKRHSQNTDTGTTQNTFTVDSDSTIGKIIVDVNLGAVDKSLTITNNALTDNRILTIKDETGTVALTSDIIPKTIIDAKGDLIVGTADNTPVRFPVGTNGKVLVADSTKPEGIFWSYDTTPYQNVLTVSPLGGDYTNLKDAMDAVTSPSYSNSWLILVYPGYYTITQSATSSITMKSYVDIVGFGEEVTEIVLLGSDGISTPFFSFGAVTNCEIKGIRFSMYPFNFTTTYMVNCTGASTVIFRDCALGGNLTSTCSLIHIPNGSGAALTFYNCVLGMTGSSGAAYTYINNSGTLTFYNSEIFHSGNGGSFTIDENANGQTRSHFFYNCYLWTSGTSSTNSLFYTIYGTAINYLFKGCRFNIMATGNPITLFQLGGYPVTNLNFEDCEITIQRQSSDTDTSGVWNLGTQASGTTNAIIKNGIVISTGTALKGSFINVQENNVGSVVVKVLDTYLYGTAKYTLSGVAPSVYFFNVYDGINLLNTGASYTGTVILSNGQLKSTVLTGTAPLVIASETLNTNLNADLLDGQHGSYYYQNFVNPFLLMGV